MSGTVFDWAWQKRFLTPLFGMDATHNGQWVAVEGTRDAGEVVTVYNVRVAEHHTYFVGSREWGFSVWAHNIECDVVWRALGGTGDVPESLIGKIKEVTNAINRGATRDEIRDLILQHILSEGSNSRATNAAEALLRLRVAELAAAAPLNTGNWGAGSYGSAEASLRDHFARHGREVGANTIQEYLQKAQAALAGRRGRGTPVPGATPNVRRFDVHGTNRYIDVDTANNQIISFGNK